MYNPIPILIVLWKNFTSMSHVSPNHGIDKTALRDPRDRESLVSVSGEMVDGNGVWVLSNNDGP